MPLACWFESLTVASRPLQRRLAETIFFFTEGNEGLGSIESLFALPAQPARHGGRKLAAGRVRPDWRTFGVIFCLESLSVPMAGHSTLHRRVVLRVR